MKKNTLCLFVCFFVMALLAYSGAKTMETPVAALIAAASSGAQLPPLMSSAFLQERVPNCIQCGAKESLSRSYSCDHFFCESCKLKNQRTSCPTCSERGKMCLICLETIKNPIKIICGHIFCEACISGVVDCPTCREVIYPYRLIAGKEKCLYCQERFSEDSSIAYITCTESEIVFERYLHFLPLPKLVERKINHYFHEQCLVKFIQVSSAYAGSGEKYFLCQIHEQHFSSDQILRKLIKQPCVLDLPVPSAQDREALDHRQYSLRMQSPSHLI